MMQTGKVELIVGKHQAESIREEPAAVGYTISASSIVRDYSPLAMMVRRGAGGEKEMKNRNAFCAHRAMGRSEGDVRLRGPVRKFYAKLMRQLEGELPEVFSEAGRSGWEMALRVVRETSTVEKSGKESPAKKLSTAPSASANRDVAVPLQG